MMLVLSLITRTPQHMHWTTYLLNNRENSVAEAILSLEGLGVEATEVVVGERRGEDRGADAKTSSSAATIFDTPVAAYIDVETLPDVPGVPRVCCKVSSHSMLLLLVKESGATRCRVNQGRARCTASLHHPTFRARCTAKRVLILLAHKKKTREYKRNTRAPRPTAPRIRTSVSWTISHYYYEYLHHSSPPSTAWPSNDTPHVTHLPLSSLPSLFTSRRCSRLPQPRIRASLRACCLYGSGSLPTPASKVSVPTRQERL